MTQIVGRNLSFSYPKKADVLSDVSFSFSAPAGASCGSVVALMGPSGSGKSTLLRLLAGIEKPTRGSLTIDPVPHFVPYLAQDAVILSQYSRRENARYRSFAGRFVSRFNENTFDQIRSALGLDDTFLDNVRPIRPMSGGQRQRLALLRDMSVAPDLLLLDEPCSGLDQPVKVELLQQLRRVVASSRVLVVYVTHHWDEVQMVADEVAFLEPPVMDRPQRLSIGSVARSIAEPPSLLAATMIAHPICNVLECERANDILTPMPWGGSIDHSDKRVHIAFGLESVHLGGEGCNGRVVAETPLVTYMQLGDRGPILAVKGTAAGRSSLRIDGPVWLFADPTRPAQAGRVSGCRQGEEACLRFQPLS